MLSLPLCPNVKRFKGDLKELSSVFPQLTPLSLVSKMWSSNIAELVHFGKQLRELHLELCAFSARIGVLVSGLPALTSRNRVRRKRMPRCLRRAAAAVGASRSKRKLFRIADADSEHSHQRWQPWRRSISNTCCHVLAL